MNSIFRLSHSAPGEPPVIALDRSAYGDVEVANVELASPMFGGGVRPHQPDPMQWLRPSAVKGHLRFWWRALNAHRYDIRELRERERRLFGGPAIFEGAEIRGGPGRVRLHVEARPPTTKSLQIGQRRVLYLPPGQRATITFQFACPSGSDERRELEDAIRAWLLLGGAGGRTRRAAGSLRVMPSDTGLVAAMPRDDASMRSHLRALLTLRQATPYKAAVSCFSLARARDILIGTNVSDGETAAHRLTNLYRAARNRFAPPQQARLGSIGPRHASPVLLSVAATAADPPSYYPVIVVTRPHFQVRDRAADDVILDTLISRLCADQALHSLLA